LENFFYFVFIGAEAMLDASLGLCARCAKVPAGKLIFPRKNSATAMQNPEARSVVRSFRVSQII
jgi:hypothetical protein